MEKGYTHYLTPHNTHSITDFMFMNGCELLRAAKCKIGATDISDHNAIHLVVHLGRKQKNTTWRLNVGILNNKTITEQIKMEI